MTKLYTVMGPGIVQGVGINGPLTEPTVIPFSYVVAMVRTGRIVYQHNPYNLNEKVQVTMDNASSIRFVPKKKEESSTSIVTSDSNYEDKTEEKVEETNNQIQSYNNSYNGKKKNKHKHPNDNENKDKEVNIIDVVETEPVKTGDAFENVNFNNN